jgi:hypothetical protein
MLLYDSHVPSIFYSKINRVTSVKGPKTKKNKNFAGSLFSSLFMDGRDCRGNCKQPSSPQSTVKFGKRQIPHLDRKVQIRR